MDTTIKSFFDRHHHVLSPILFVFGFFIDLLTLTQVDLFYDNLVILIHLTSVSVSIFLLHLAKRDQVFPEPVEWMMRIAPYTLVISFGSILSGYVIFYTKSASILASWPFLLGLYLLFLGSEIIFKRVQDSYFQLGMWYAAVFSFCIFFIPVVVRMIGPWIFILSSVVSIVLALLYLLLIAWADHALRPQLPTLKTMVLGICGFFMILYFNNIIPPIPLSMKQSGIYHEMYRDDAQNLIGVTHDNEWDDIFDLTRDVFLVPGEKLFAYNSVYAPRSVETELKHVWEYQNEDSTWTEYATVPYHISGGRKDGFRWFTYVTPDRGGIWRVRTTTEYGQEVGRILFKIILTQEPPYLIKQVL